MPYMACYWLRAINDNLKHLGRRSPQAPPRGDAMSQRLRDYQPALAYMKLMHSGYENEQRCWGGPYTTALLRLTLIGWMERKPFDLSDLAFTLNISRQQTMRRVDALVSADLLRTERLRNRVVVSPTERLIDYAGQTLPVALGRASERWRAITLVMSVSPLPWALIRDTIMPLDLTARVAELAPVLAAAVT